MLSRIARQDGLGSQHLEEATESTQERDFARSAIFMRFSATEFGQQLDFGPLEGHPLVEEEACGDPGQGD
jgi:hypothetical protein